jgi:ATP-dependent DNA helicase RecG
MMIKDTLQNSVQYLKGVGPRKAQLLEAMGICTWNDLLCHIPRDYQDWGNIKKINELLPGEVSTIQGRVIGIKEYKPHGGSRGVRHILKVALADETDVCHLVWFNQPYRSKQYQWDKVLVVTGKVRQGPNLMEIDPLEVRTVEELAADQSEMGLVPVYPLTEGLDQRFFRNALKQVLENVEEDIEDPFPDWILKKYHFMPRKKAFHEIHFPNSLDLAIEARKRLAYEEFLMHQLAFCTQKKYQESIHKPFLYEKKYTLIEKFLAGLPFSLTQAQRVAARSIYHDLLKSSPMNRLLQGDVGSGKTLVAFLAMLLSAANGYQSVLMVPTEVLAIQHYRTFHNWLRPLGMEPVLLTGEVKGKRRKQSLEDIKSGRARIVIGTHALLEEGVEFQSLSLVVIDEQHRFGVVQRETIRNKGSYPDVLIMTATPIPRTLSLTVYGDLEISTINELPPGRVPIKTFWKWDTEINSILDFMQEQIQAGRQAYVIYPLVEESQKIDLKAAIQMHEHLQKDIFPQLKVGLVHGKMAKTVQREVMEAFARGEIHILVSTTVIEVGIDVPNATVMLIEHAERFGLSQLHQLRGRIGRGAHESFCIMVSPENVSPLVRERLSILTHTTDGFIIAERDLVLRGPGEMIGTIQHGMTPFKFANLLQDQNWLIKARDDAQSILQDTEQHKYQRIYGWLKNYFGEKIAYAITS